MTDRPVQLYSAANARLGLQDFFAGATTVWAWQFRVDQKFLDHMLKDAVRLHTMKIIIDAKQSTPEPLHCELSIALHLRRWAKNRTMHRKLWLAPNEHRMFLTTANATLGSWMMAENDHALITDPEIVTNASLEFAHAWTRLPQQSAALDSGARPT